MTADEFVEVLRASTLAARRPVDDRACIESMVRHANLTVTARQEGRLVGVARTVTDFSYSPTSPTWPWIAPCNRWASGAS